MIIHLLHCEVKRSNHEHQVFIKNDILTLLYNHLYFQHFFLFFVFIIYVLIYDLEIQLKFMKYFYIQVPINSPSLQMIQKCIKTNFSSTYTFYNILLGLSAVYLYVQIIPLFIYVNKDSMSNSFD